MMDKKQRQALIRMCQNDIKILEPLINTEIFKELEEVCKKLCKTPEYIEYIDTMIASHPKIAAVASKEYWTTAGKIRSDYEDTKKALKSLEDLKE